MWTAEWLRDELKGAGESEIRLTLKEIMQDEFADDEDEVRQRSVRIHSIKHNNAIPPLQQHVHRPTDISITYRTDQHSNLCRPPSAAPAAVLLVAAAAAAALLAGCFVVLLQLRQSCGIRKGPTANLCSTAATAQTNRRQQARLLP